ncbi:response regulator transcription factor [Rhizobium sp. BK376]|uniref:response regulator transcription factor n=1 Tax=Rhizobium sp. BK376 TaxID=2512149 RepID=UPI0010525C8C|nr:response regulator transcription factor [Rhizobium sp. BK376]TCR85294.1 two-component system response regulator TctD [Rhizobium sp. BK376]
MRLLLVEDNPGLSTWLAKLLRSDHYVVDCVADGETAIQGTDLGTYDLAIVDLGLPGITGQELIRQLRAKQLSMPIMILTADDKLSTRVEGLTVGADDYMTKPFEVQEFDARLKALLRRAKLSMAQVLRFGPLAFDCHKRNFTMNSEPFTVSAREHALLEALIRHGGATVHKEILMDAMYGMDDEVSPATIEVNVHRLRKRLENSPVSIETIRGVGYLLRLARS